MNAEQINSGQWCIPGPILHEGENFVSIRLSPDYGNLISPCSCSVSLFQGPETVVVFYRIAENVRCTIYDRYWSKQFAVRNTFEPVVNVHFATKLNLEYPDHQSSLREQVSLKICLSTDSIELPCASNSDIERGIVSANSLIRSRIRDHPPVLSPSDIIPVASSLFFEGGLMAKIRQRPCTTCFTCRPASIEFDDNSLVLYRPVFTNFGECIVSLIADIICLPISCIFPANYVLEERGCLFIRRDDGQIQCIVYCKKLCYEHQRTVYDGVVNVRYRVETHTDRTTEEISKFKVAVLELTHLYGTSDVYLGEYRVEMNRRIAEVQSFIELQGAIRAISSTIDNVMHHQQSDQSDVSYVELKVFTANVEVDQISDQYGDRGNEAVMPLVEAAVVND